jgi:hypothetical protein
MLPGTPTISSSPSPFLQCDNLGLCRFRAYIMFLHKIQLCVFNYDQTLLFFPKSPVDAIWDKPLFIDGARAGVYYAREPCNRELFVIL